MRSQRTEVDDNLQLLHDRSREHERGSIVARILDGQRQLRLLLRRVEQRRHRQLVMMSVKCCLRKDDGFSGDEKSWESEMKIQRRHQMKFCSLRFIGSFMEYQKTVPTQFKFYLELFNIRNL
jgi:hypothetical protein